MVKSSASAELLDLIKYALAIADGFRNPAKFFGKSPGKTFRQWAERVHPDKHPGHRDEATIAFSDLNRLRQVFENKPVAASATVLGRYVVVDGLAAGDVSDVYLGHKTDGTVTGEARLVLKVGNTPQDNDLMDREVQALKLLAKSPLDAKYQKYLPTLVDTFKAGGRRVNVMEEVTGAYTLTELLSVAEDQLRDFRHWIWIFNRVLSALWVAHNSGVFHGAVTPDHMLYLPENHGMVLIDWTASVLADKAENDHVPYVSEKWEHLVAPEIRRKMIGEPSDLFMAARCMLYAMDVALDGKIPATFRHVLEYCTTGQPTGRPQTVDAAQRLWKRAAELSYGPPKFLPLEIKPRA